MNRRAVGARVLTVALVAFALPATAAEAARPDLKVAALSPLTPAVSPNEQVRAQVTVRNAGKASSPASAVRLYLSRDGRRSKSDKRLPGKPSVKALKRGKRARATARSRLPGGTAPGGYQLIACADPVKREGKKGNNCKAVPFGVTTAAQRVNVAPALDSGAAFDGILSADNGGTLVSVGADGTQYYLVVPAGALTHDQRVTMTPVTSIGGLPLSGGLVGAVQIGDDSFQLAKPAQLVIRRDGLAPQPSQVAFGYHGGGEDFFLTPFGEPPAGFPADSITIPVFHGGGYGVANASAEEIAAQKAKPPARAEDRLAQAAAAQGPPAKRPGRISAAQVDGDAVAATARSLWTERIRPQLKAAETNDAVLDQAMADAFGWLRTLELIGLGDEFEAEADQMVDSIDKGLKNAYKKAKERCLDGDFNQVTRLIAIERFRQLTGLGDEATDLFQDIDDCLRFELRVTSHLEVHERVDNDRVDQVSELKAEVPLQFNFETFRLDGQAPFRYEQFTYNAVVSTNLGGCEVTGTSTATGVLQNGQLDVPSASVSTGDPGAPPAPPEITMLINPGQPQEEIHTETQSCFGPSSDTQFESQWLDEWTTFFHQPDHVSDLGVWAFDRFTPGEKPVVGTRTFTLVAGARTLDETWSVVHVPRR